MKKYKVIGMMSGTSLDGLDLCYCHFEKVNGKWNYGIIESITVDYTTEWIEKLKNAPLLSSTEFLLLHFRYGKWIGKMVNKHFSKHEVDFISSHGHTIFHQPDRGLTFQLGHGQSIANESQHKTICDYRTQDVLLGGNGAPLVPIGDKELFPEYDACINLGGFANISFNTDNQRFAFDICPVNIALNYLSSKIGKTYDTDGKSAKEGNLEVSLLKKMNSLPYYSNEPPKSLGREWVEENIIPLLEKNKIEPADQLRTFTEHAALQITKVINNLGTKKKILFTGGGCLNKFLMERIIAKCNSDISVPNKSIINYKEALIFAFIGVLHEEKTINILSSVTGAKKSSCSGVVFNPE